MAKDGIIEFAKECEIHGIARLLRERASVEYVEAFRCAMEERMSGETEIDLICQRQES